jgi:hypothetical protein
VFLKVYADESYDNEVYCSGSFLGWPKTFYYLGLKWETRLEQDGLTYFRASDCEHLDGEYSPQNPPGYGLTQARARASSVRYDLTKIIETKPIVGISMSVVKQDFKQLIDENPKAKKYFGTDILVFSYKLLIRATVDLMEKDWPEPKYSNLKIAFSFDEHTKWQAAEEAYEQLKFEDASCAKRLLVVAHADDKEYPGLQMADLMVYEARLQTRQWLQKSQEERHAFKALKKSHNIYFMGLMGREELLADLVKLPDYR